MTVTVRQALQTWPLTQAQLLAGARGLDNKISWTHIVEIFEDPYFPSPGILLCSTGYGFKDNPQLQASVMAHVGEVGIAAFLMKTGYELKEIPDRMLADAERFSIPFLKLPQSIPFVDVTKAVAGLLLEKDAEILKQGQEILRRLMEAQLSGGGFSAIAQVLGESLSCSAFITNRRGEMLSTYLHLSPQSSAPSLPADPADPSVIMHLKHYSQRIGAAAGLDRLFRLNKIVSLDSGLGTGQKAAFIAPIQFEHRMRGFVGVVRDQKMTDLALWAIEAAGLVAATEYRVLRVEEVTEQRLVGNLLDTLITHDQLSDPLAFHRLASWGYDVSMPCRIVLVEIEFDAGTPRKERSIDYLRPLWELYFRSSDYEPVIRFVGPTSIALKQVAHDDLERERKELTDFHSRLVRQLRTARVWVAVGRPAAPLSGLRATHAEATRAMTILRRTRSQGGALCAEDLGIDNVLLDLATSERALEYARGVLAPLLESEGVRGRSQLLSTLQAYLAADADTQKTADRLFVHANTVRYRLKTIEELTGRSLQSSNNRTIFTIALRLLDLSNTPPAGA